MLHARHDPAHTSALRRDLEQSLGAAGACADTDALLPPPAAATTSRRRFLGGAGALVALSALAAAAARWALAPAARPSPLGSAASAASDGQPRWFVNGTGTGCSNWKDIKIGVQSFEASVDACGERCAAEPGCVLFNYNEDDICDSTSVPGACVTYLGDCERGVNDCFDLYAMSRHLILSGEQLGADEGVGSEADADADGEGVLPAPTSPPETFTLTGFPANISDIAQSVQYPHNSAPDISTALWLAKGVGFERVSLSRCALVGASSNLLGSMAGDLIDSYDTVIRVNRIPRGAIQRDVGRKTDVLVLNTHHDPTEPKVEVASLGGNGTEPPWVNCSSLDNCRSTAIVWRADEQQVYRTFGSCDPQELANAWGRGRPFVACVRRNVSGISWGFSQVRGHVPSSGFVAFVTFLTLCKELDLFGFGGTATADGHLEKTTKHDLVAEHDIQDAIAAGHKPAWTNSHIHGSDDPDALEWIWHHRAKVRIWYGFEIVQLLNGSRRQRPGV